jgi:hypothetical protein
MKLLVDSDAFCKLGLAGLLRDAALVLGSDLQDCGRLAALPYMLRKGRLRRHYGAVSCDALIPVAESILVLQQPSAEWLDKLASIEAVDPGEAQIIGAAAEFGCMVLSNDKRALRAVKDVEGFPAALAGHIAVLEAVMLALCDRFGPEDMRRRVAPLCALDKTVEICFSPGTADPREGLRSYYGSLAIEVRPLILWDPQKRDGI